MCYVMARRYILISAVILGAAYLKMVDEHRPGSRSPAKAAGRMPGFLIPLDGAWSPWRTDGTEGARLGPQSGP